MDKLCWSPPPQRKRFNIGDADFLKLISPDARCVTLQAL